MNKNSERRFVTREANQAYAKSVKSAAKKAEAVESGKSTKDGKLLTPVTPMDTIAVAVIKKIREDRSIFQKNVPESTAEGATIVSFAAKINTANVSVGRVEKAGKASTLVVAKAFITVTPEDGAEVTITGPHAALAWKDLTKVLKGHSGAKKVQADADLVARAAKALGL